MANSPNSYHNWDSPSTSCNLPTVTFAVGFCVLLYVAFSMIGSAKARSSSACANVYSGLSTLVVNVLSIFFSSNMEFVVPSFVAASAASYTFSRVSSSVSVASFFGRLRGTRVASVTKMLLLLPALTSISVIVKPFRILSPVIFSSGVAFITSIFTIGTGENDICNVPFLSVPSLYPMKFCAEIISAWFQRS